MREQEYKYAFSKLREYGYEPYIFESCQSAPPSFLEEFSSNVIYTNVNDDSLKNKGVNEARSLIEGFKHCQFDGETMIIKMTGRYWFNSRYFLDFVENHPSTDAFVKFHEEYGMDHDVIAGCYAIKYKYFKELLEKLDLAEMEAELIPIEWKIGEQIRAMQNKGRRVMIMQKLDITANQGSPNPPRYFYW